MFSHVVVGANDMAKAQKFYDAVFGVLGVDAAPNGDRVIYADGKGGMFMITKPINGEAACFANGGTIGFSMTDADQCKAWHDAGVAAGGTSVENPPGVRDLGSMKLYAAYLRDPDGNKLCGVAPAG